MRELYYERTRLYNALKEGLYITQADEEILTLIDSLNLILEKNEKKHKELNELKSSLRKKIKLLELVYFCQNGSYPNER